MARLRRASYRRSSRSPVTESIGDDSAQLIVAVQRYLDGIKSYTACIQAELAAAGGDAAPVSLRIQLVVRNNAAVAEAGAVLALFGERLTPARNLHRTRWRSLSQRARRILPEPRPVRTIRDSSQHRRWSDVSRLGPVRTNRLCSNELIEPYAFETTITSPQRECALGRFFDLTEEQ